MVVLSWVRAVSTVSKPFRLATLIPPPVHLFMFFPLASFDCLWLDLQNPSSVDEWKCKEAVPLLVDKVQLKASPGATQSLASAQYKLSAAPA